MKMISYTDKNGKSTGWMSDPPTEKELKRLSIKQLMVIAERKKGIKNTLIEFLKK